jgi:hypothetical protein
MGAVLPGLNGSGCESTIMFDFGLFGRALRKTSNIMKSESFHAEDLAGVLRRSKIARIFSIKRGTREDLLVFYGQMISAILVFRG